MTNPERREQAAGGSPQKTYQVKKYRIAAEPDSVRSFLSRYLPDSQLIKRTRYASLSAGNAFTLEPVNSASES